MNTRTSRWILGAGTAIALGAALFVTAPAEAAPHHPHARQHLRQHARQHVRRQLRRDLYGHRVHRYIVHGRRCAATCFCRRPVRFHAHPRRYGLRPYGYCGVPYRRFR